MGKIEFFTSMSRRITPANLKNIKYAPVTPPHAKDTFQRCCELRYKVDNDKLMVFGDIPDDYVNITKYWEEAVPARKSRFGKMLPAKEAHWEEIKSLKTCYYLEHLFSHGKGQGKDAVKTVVTKSLENPQTQGRVVLHADVIDGKTSPAGFYYKMGFRSTNNSINKQLTEWITKGGKRENAPMVTGMMYLPKENISHCLNY